MLNELLKIIRFEQQEPVRRSAAIDAIVRHIRGQYAVSPEGKLLTRFQNVTTRFLRECIRFNP